MELSKQIKRYRSEAHLSQEELAEKVFVSRQTISNWENDKSYPDVNSLLLISEVFQISLDNLIKGDVERMRKEIDEQERLRFRKDSMIAAILLLVAILSTVPLAMMFGWYGIAISVFFAIILLFYGLRVARYERKYNIGTFKDILALWEQENLNKINE